MNAREDIICRLCLKVPHNRFLLIDEATKQGLEVLSVKMNFDVSNDPLMCEECAETVKRSLSFILACLETEKAILLFDTGEDAINIDLRDVYAHKSKEIVSADSVICRFCIKKVEERSCVPLNVSMKEHVFMDAVKGCMSMMDWSIIKNSLICFHCRDNMEGYIKFLWNCHHTEEKINMCQQNEGIRSPKKIVLSNVFEQFSKCTLGYFSGHAQICEVKKEEHFAEEFTEIPYTNVYNTIEKEFAAKDKGIDNFLLHHNGDLSDRILCTCDAKVSSCLGCNVSAYEAPSLTDNVKIEAEFSEINEELRIKSEELNINGEVTLSEGTHPQSNLHKSEVCMCNKKREIKKHMLKHEDISEAMHKCTACDFKTVYKRSLKVHSLTHKTEAEVTMYKCAACDYKTILKGHLKRHSLIHKTEAELTMYKCTTCDFKTIYKDHLKRHSLTHKTEAEVRMYKCTACDYKTVNKSHLKHHFLTHKTKAELTMYKCKACGYKTKHKKTIQSHCMAHKSKAELSMYKCTACDYKTIRKGNLKCHFLTHKTEAELTMYKCVTCDFKTKYKNYLKTHSLAHNAVV